MGYKVCGGKIHDRHLKLLKNVTNTTRSEKFHRKKNWIFLKIYFDCWSGVLNLWSTLPIESNISSFDVFLMREAASASVFSNQLVARTWWNKREDQMKRKDLCWRLCVCVCICVLMHIYLYVPVSISNTRSSSIYHNPHRHLVLTYAHAKVVSLSLSLSFTHTQTSLSRSHTQIYTNINSPQHWPPPLCPPLASLW